MCINGWMDDFQECAGGVVREKIIDFQFVIRRNWQLKMESSKK